MSVELEIVGNIGRDFADKIRGELNGPTVSLSSGFGGQRILTVIGSLTGAQIEKLKAAISAVLGLNQIKSLKISKTLIEVGQVPSDKLPELEETIGRLLDKLKS